MAHIHLPPLPVSRCGEQLDLCHFLQSLKAHTQEYCQLLITELIGEFMGRKQLGPTLPECPSAHPLRLKRVKGCARLAPHHWISQSSNSPDLRLPGVAVCVVNMCAKADTTAAIVGSSASTLPNMPLFSLYSPFLSHCRKYSTNNCVTASEPLLEHLSESLQFILQRNWLTGR